MIEFKELTMRNFLSHGDNPNTFILNKSPTTMVSGKNGNGKSTMMDGITFALFGKSFREIKKASLINSINQSSSVVTITFTNGNKFYKITRGMKPNILEIECNGHKMHEDASVADAQKFIENQILGFDFNTFCRVCIMSTMNYTPFMTLPAAARRDFVENMLDLKMFSEMNKLHKAEIATLKDDINNIDKQLDLIDAKLKEKQNFVTYIKTNSSDDLAVHTDLLRKHVNELNEIKLKLEKMELRDVSTDEEAILLNAKNHEYLDAIDKAKAFASGHKSIIRENNNTIEYLTGHDSCGQCKQQITDEDSKRIINELEEANANFQSKIDESEHIIKQLTLRKNDNWSKLQNVIKDIRTHNSIIEGYNQKKTMLFSNAKATSEHIEKIKAKSTLNADEVETEIKAFKDVKHQLKTQFEELTEELKVSNTILELLKDTGIKADIIKQYIPLLCAHVNSYLSKLNISLTFNMDENFNESIRTRYTNEFTYNNLSAGERSRLDLAMAFSWRAVARLKGSVDTNLLILDEVLDANLDEAGTQAALEIVNDIAQDNTNIFIVSHKANLEEHVRSVLVLEKENGFTKIK